VRTLGDYVALPEAAKGLSAADISFLMKLIRVRCKVGRAIDSIARADTRLHSRAKGSADTRGEESVGR